MMLFLVSVSYQKAPTTQRRSALVVHLTVMHDHVQWLSLSPLHWPYWPHELLVCIVCHHIESNSIHAGVGYKEGSSDTVTRFFCLCKRHAKEIKWQAWASLEHKIVCVIPSHLLANMTSISLYACFIKHIDLSLPLDT